MNSSAWDVETTRFLALPTQEQLKWLATVMSALTIFARTTYATDGEGLDDPKRLRSFNELLHRVADQLSNKMAGRQGRPDDVFVKVLTESLASLAVSPNALLPYLGRA
jgi:hypothetical protein